MKDLPATVAYFEADLTLGSSKLVVTSPETSFSMSSTTINFHHKQRNTGHDVIASVRSFQASVAAVDSKEKQPHVICYGSLPSQDLISFSLSETDGKKDIIGSVHRIYVGDQSHPDVLQARDFLTGWPVHGCA